MPNRWYTEPLKLRPSEVLAANRHSSRRHVDDPSFGALYGPNPSRL
jgi:hypothetical protein